MVELAGVLVHGRQHVVHVLVDGDGSRSPPFVGGGLSHHALALSASSNPKDSPLLFSLLLTLLNFFGNQNGPVAHLWQRLPTETLGGSRWFMCSAPSLSICLQHLARILERLRNSNGPYGCVGVLAFLNCFFGHSEFESDGSVSQERNREMRSPSLNEVL